MARLFNADIGNKIKFYRYLFCSCTTRAADKGSERYDTWLATVLQGIRNEIEDGTNQ